jgi:hypothetical protein
MKRHPLDAVSLVFGALFALIGLAFAISPDAVTGDNLGWVVPIPLIVIGLLVIAASARRGLVERRATAAEPSPAMAAAWPEPTPASAWPEPTPASRPESTADAPWLEADASEPVPHAPEPAPDDPE